MLARASPRQRQVVALDAAAVVGHPDQPAAALLQCHVDARGAGVEAVLDQLLHHAGRPLNHFARGEFVDQAGIERADVGHGRVRAELRN
jgi:hypothetical protein